MLTPREGVIEFFLPMIPPTVTQQEHEFKVVKGRVVVYDPPRLKEARRKFMDLLLAQKHRMPGWDYIFPLEGPLRLVTKWIWPTRQDDGEHRDGEWKTTRPDTDNLIKLFKDCMTRTHYWNDDAQVVSEITEKFHGSRPGIYVRVERIGEDTE